MVEPLRYIFGWYLVSLGPSKWNMTGAFLM